MEECYFLQAEACNFTKSNTPTWVLFMFFKLNEWYQIAQSMTFWNVAQTELLISLELKIQKNLN